jgi:Na+-translocating ferredoxin:NAD+ oxidoreductase RnfE subunit
MLSQLSYAPIMLATNTIVSSVRLVVNTFYYLVYQVLGVVPTDFIIITYLKHYVNTLF